MEEILKLQFPVYIRRLPRKSLYSVCVVALCVMTLGLCARICSADYQMMPETVSETGRDMSGVTDIGEMSRIITSPSNEHIVAIIPAGMADIFVTPQITVRQESKPAAADVIDDENVTETPVQALAPEEEVSPVMVTVSAYGNGGIPELTVGTYAPESFTTDVLTCPKRLGKVFDGWYVDEECNIPFEGTDGQQSLTLYAGWAEIPGLISNDLGHITGYTDDAEIFMDGLIRIPSREECTGIEAGAFDILGEEVFEVYIPGNITYIAPGAFDNLSNLMHIEVAVNNPVYYSVGGVVYYSDGTEAIYPAGRADR